tara:strand:- start:344 stop:613 length:270 start_codon:yes stop_codon:yes gene_type:complete
MKNVLDKNVRRKIVKKSGFIATTVSVVTGIFNMILSLLRNVKGGVDSSSSLPWLQSLLIMIGVFVVVFVVLIVYYFIIKNRIEDIPDHS